MIASAVAAVTDAVRNRIPAPLDPPEISDSPLFTAARDLAEIVGADPSPVLDAAEALSSDKDIIAETASAAGAVIAAAGEDLLAIAGHFQADALATAPLLLNPLTLPGALADLTRSAVVTLTQAQMRLTQLAAELAPLVEKLLALIAAAAARPPLNPSDTGVHGQRELATLAASAGVPSEPVSASAEAPSAGSVSAEGSAAGRAAVEAAKSQVGTPYVWGGTGPGGFDCSGLTSWAYRQAGVELPRMAHEQAIGRQVSHAELQPGDLAVWDGHVAMYAGDGMYIEAGDPVQLNPVRTENLGMTFRGFWRPTG
ncbi:C40 family peptidase [Corynebacterium sp.]|uniref:C40 family peptidase n=1 Tax=Corynebacterium sp. TaxID=1720 RepID=UPI002A917C47|nr:C40 family peptidase [Corynebacterium sp.]MDY5785503.1 C40 family peptidase [Corynebacterium sp.]